MNYLWKFRLVWYNLITSEKNRKTRNGEIQIVIPRYQAIKEVPLFSKNLFINQSGDIIQYGSGLKIDAKRLGPKALVGL